MYSESMTFDNQQDVVSKVSGSSDMASIDITAEYEDAMSDTEFARKVLSYKYKINQVQCLPIGRNPVSGAIIYESFESACKRTFAR